MKQKTEWIVFDEGRYGVDRAVLVTSNDSLAMELTNTMIEIYADPRGKRHLKGYATLENLLLVNLLEESGEIDLILDFSGAFKYRLPHPQIRSGKIFSPETFSTVQFIPTAPWTQIPENGFKDYLANLQFASDSTVGI